MTMDEYKQWVMNEMSQMPVSAWVRSTYSSGATVIKEEAFERMKSDPEYENYVLNRVRSAYSVSSLPAGSNNVSYDVIGASPEECYGYAGPVGNSSSNISGNEKSWWEKRHEKTNTQYLAYMQHGADHAADNCDCISERFAGQHTRGKSGDFGAALRLDRRQQRPGRVCKRCAVCALDRRDDEQRQNDDCDELGQDRFGSGCFGFHGSHS